MELQSPIKQGIKVKKWYGSNTELNSLTDLLLCVSQGFGGRPEVYGLGGHNGLDFVYEYRTPVYACHAGKLTYVEEKDENGKLKGYGKHVIIIGEGFKTTYAHLDEGVVKSEVKRGELIGYGNSTGFSTNHHLHLTTKLIDSQGNALNRNNGHDGAVDPTPYLVWVENFKKVMNKEFIELYYLAAFNRLPTEEEANFWRDKPHIDIVQATIRDREMLLEKYVSQEW